MGRGRAPCCDKNQVKRGPWSPSEDFRLITFIQRYGHDNWRALPKLAGLKRCGKSCRLRWINYLKPDVKRGNFTKEDEDTIIKLHAALGNKWSTIASHLPGRTDNEIKNVWNTHLKKRALSMKNSDKPKSSKSEEILKELSSITSSSSSSSSSILSCNHVKPSSISSHQSDEESIGKRSNWGDQCNFTGIEKIDQVINMNNDVFYPQDKNNLKKTTTCSVSSYDSNNASSNTSTQIDVSWTEDEMGKFLLGDYDDHVNNTLLKDEVNKPEVPLEADHDFWNMLASLSPLQKANSDQLVQLHEAKADPKGSCFVEVDNKMWFRYLENELGILEENTNDDFELTHQQLFAQDHRAKEIDPTETFQCDQSSLNI